MTRWILLLLLCGGARAAQEIAAVTTTFEITGGMSTMATSAPFSSTNDRYVVHSDAVIRSAGSAVFVINRFQSDNVLSLNGANAYSVFTQFSVGALSNPQDLLLVDPTRAYVTRYESTRLWIVQPFTGAKLGEIDLGSYADADGIPEMAQMAKVGSNVFVTVQRLDRNAFFAPTGGSALLVIDPGSDAVVDEIPLVLQNPDWRLRYAPSLQRLVSVAAGAFSVLDGGVELIDPYARTSERIALAESALGGDILDALIVTPTIGWVLHADPSFNTILRRFDPSDGSVDAPTLTTSGFQLSDLELSDDGKLFVSDRTPSQPGVRVYDAYGGASLGGPISLGLPPFDLTLVGTSPVATGPALLRSPLRAYPQPSASTVFFEWSRPSAPSSPGLEIVDARGRRVRSLRFERVEVGLRAHWDGNDEQGRPVAVGRYFARAGAEKIPISVVR